MRRGCGGHEEWLLELPAGASPGDAVFVPEAMKTERGENLRGVRL